MATGSNPRATAPPSNARVPPTLAHERGAPAGGAAVSLLAVNKNGRQRHDGRVHKASNGTGTGTACRQRCGSHRKQRARPSCARARAARTSTPRSTRGVWDEGIVLRNRSTTLCPLSIAGPNFTLKAKLGSWCEHAQAPHGHPRPHARAGTGTNTQEFVRHDHRRDGCLSNDGR